MSPTPHHDSIPSDRDTGRDRPEGPGSSGTAFGTSYPHDIHPGLVPGFAADEARMKFGIDKLVLGVTGVLIAAFVVWGVASPASVSAVSSALFGWAMEKVGWLFSLSAILILFFVLYLAFGRFGQIPLGKDGEEPEFSRFSWVAMMFGAGIGVGIFFYGPSEPLAHFASPPPQTVEAGTRDAMHLGLAQSFFHWGLHAWAIYALVGGAVAYVSYRRGRVPLMSSVFRTLFGDRATDGVAGKLVDIFAIIATVFGTAAALGIAALQIGQGIEIVTGVSDLANATLLIVIAVLSVAFVLSAVSGVARGIRYLSSTNIVLTLGVILFVFVAGPTLFLVNLLPSAVMEYLDEIFSMMGKSLSWGPETLEWQSMWSVFYWAWWISWSPFVGIFVARISRGRSIKEFMLVVIAVPSVILVLAFGVFGGTAIWMNTRGRAGMVAEASPQELLFAMFSNLPLDQVMPLLVMLILSVFFITSADSAAVVMGTLSSKGDPSPRNWVVVFWGLMTMGISVVMLLAGGRSALSALQNLVILTAVPFAVILLLMMVAFVRDLSTDPLYIRRRYASSAVRKAVRRGIEEHGDDFELAVQRAPEGEGAGAEFDSTSENVTDWYQRTDEEGNKVDYDWSTDTWADGWRAEGAEPDRTVRP